MSLANLLGIAQASASGAVPDPLAEDEILVEADPYRLENPAAITQRDLALEKGRETSEHKGMFGVKGTLRDVLGVVGDAFLIQSGNKPRYAPHREQERISDAMAGFTEDPMAAIERVAGENPMLAQKMLEQYNLNQYRTSQTTNAAQRAGTSAADLNRKNVGEAMDYVSQAYAAAVATGNPQALAEAERLAGLVSQKYGIPMEELGVKPNMTPEEAAILAGRGATVNQNLRLPQQERSLDIREEQERGRNRRNTVNEAGRNSRAQQAEEGRERRSLRSGQRRTGGARQLRGSEDNPTSSLRIRPVGQQ